METVRRRFCTQSISSPLTSPRGIFTVFIQQTLEQSGTLPESHSCTFSPLPSPLPLPSRLRVFDLACLTIQRRKWSELAPSRAIVCSFICLD